MDKWEKTGVSIPINFLEGLDAFFIYQTSFPKTHLLNF